MAPPLRRRKTLKQGSFPRANQVKDTFTQQALIEAFNAINTAKNDVSSTRTAVSASDALIAEMQATITSLTTRLTLVEAGGGISPPSTVGGASSGGTSGGVGSGTPGGGGGTTQPPTPAPNDVPNFTGDISQAKADLVAAGVPLTGSPCANFQIAKLTTWRLSSSYPQIGLLSKPSGNNCDGYAVDIITWRPEVGSGIIYVFNMLIDSEGAQTPTWDYLGPEDEGRWSAPVPGAI